MSRRGPPVLDLATRDQLKESIIDCIGADQGVLDRLREEIRPLRAATRPIQPRAAASISIVGTDGGNNQLRFDPFLVQLVRVVDSSNNEYCLEAVSPTTPVEQLDRRQFAGDGTPRTPLGEMMQFLGVSTLPELSYMIQPAAAADGAASTDWVHAYRELVEWSILFSLLKKDFGSDTLLVYDGLLRSLVFAHDLFQRLLEGMRERIAAQQRHSRRRIYLAGVAKHSKVLSRYRLAMALEQVLQTGYPACVAVPREIEERAYLWREYVRDDRASGSGGINRFVGGKMFLVKFGAHQRDPVWPVDIFLPQADCAQAVLGSLLADTANGFPIPHYPACLQKAHANAALVNFDFDILQDVIYEGVRTGLKEDAAALDAFQLQDVNPALRRYE